MFEDPDNGDIFRSIPVILRVLQVVDDPNHPRHPRIYFGGEMGGMSSATMSGFVYMSHDDQVCWRFVSYHVVEPLSSPTYKYVSAFWGTSKSHLEFRRCPGRRIEVSIRSTGNVDYYIPSTL